MEETQEKVKGFQIKKSNTLKKLSILTYNQKRENSMYSI